MTAINEVDYLQFWGVDQAVFARPVPPKRLFSTPRLDAMKARLGLACAQSQALVLVTGEPGTGKSTLMRWLFQHLPPATHDALLVAMVKKERQPGWLTPRIAQLMGVTTGPEISLEDTIRKTAARFDELIAEKRRLVVAVDAAHYAEAPAALDEIVALLNLQSLGRHCVSFVLAGSEALLPVIDETPELATRLAFHAELGRLTRDETAAYIAHRLELAGLSALFESDALDLVHLKTRGLFAAINACADSCLVEAYQRDARRVTLDIAKAATANLGPRELAPVPRPKPPSLGRSESDSGSPREGERSQTPGQAQTAALGQLSKPKAALTSAAFEPSPGSDTDAATGSRKESASIKLSSLFKSDSDRQKP